MSLSESPYRFPEPTFTTGRIRAVAMPPSTLRISEVNEPFGADNFGIRSNARRVIAGIDLAQKIQKDQFAIPIT